MANAWLSHVKKTMKSMKSKGTYKKGEGLKKVIKEAKKTYKKHRGGADVTSSVDEDMTVGGTSGPTNGGRRRKTRRSSRR
jgi:hypothetical protein